MSDQFTRSGARFGVVDTDVVTNPDLSARAIRVYVVLCTFAPGATGREVWPLRTTLATLLGGSTDTVDRGVKELVAAGLLTVTQRDRTSSVYHLHDMAELPANMRRMSRSSAPEEPQISGGGGRRSAAQNSTNEQHHEEDHSTSVAASDDGALPGLVAVAPVRPENRVNALARKWWEAQDPRPAGRGAWAATTRSIAAILKAGWAEADVDRALATLSPPLSIGRIEWELNRTRNGGRGPIPVSDFSGDEWAPGIKYDGVTTNG